jgi:hypothetical protein
LREPDLERLLRDGSALLAGGLLELVQVRDGMPNSAFVQGLAGTLFAARAWKQQYPEGLLVTVDSPVARSWLGLGEVSVRSDLIGLWEHDGELAMEAIEVKTSHDPIVAEVINEAVNQTGTTLEAISHGLTGTDVLAMPRREMLKEVLKHAVDVAPFEHEPATRQVRQQRWIGWLMRLFGENPTPAVTLSGRVIRVHLRDANPPESARQMHGTWNIRIETLGEQRCLELGLGFGTPRGGSDSGQPPPSSDGPPPPSGDGPPPPPRTPTPASTSPTISVPELAGDVPAIQPDVMLGQKPGGGAVHWRPFDTAKALANPHAVIVGGSGSGKTETLKVFLAELRRAGVGCLVFDFKDDYVQPDFVEQVGATIHFAEDGLPVNPMIPGIDPHRGLVEITSHVFTLESTLTKVYDLGAQQAQTLRQVLFGLYERAGFSRTPALPSPSAIPPAFADIRAELESAEATTLLGRLSPIFDLNLFRPDRGALGELFTGAHVIRFTRLPGEEVKRACAEIVLLSCYQEMLRLGHYRGVRLALVIDEAHRIANLAAVSLLLREARAYGVAVLLSSQQARDFADDIYANADTLIGLKVNEPNDTERLGALLGGKSQARELAEIIRRFQPGEAFMKNSAYQPQVRFRVMRLAERGSLT